MYFRLLIVLFTGLINIHLQSCSPRHPILDLNGVPSFEPAASEQILFLTFRVAFVRNSAKEKIGLLGAISGKGRLKDIRRPVESPYQIRVIPRYSVRALENEIVFDHPLYHVAEVPDPSGVPTKQKMYAKEGSFTITLQANRHISSLDFYSVTPGREPYKIYTLRLKQ